MFALCVAGAEHDTGLQPFPDRPGNSPQEAFKIRAESIEVGQGLRLFLVLPCELSSMARE
jgi:hypothetical protein